MKQSERMLKEADAASVTELRARVDSLTAELVREPREDGEYIVRDCLAEARAVLVRYLRTLAEELRAESIAAGDAVRAQAEDWRAAMLSTDRAEHAAADERIRPLREAHETARGIFNAAYAEYEKTRDEFSRAAFAEASPLPALWDFINARPGINPADYDGYMRGYHSDRGKATRDRTRALAELQTANGRKYDAESMRYAFLNTYSGRLTWDGHALHYTAGQCEATEYREAAAEVLKTYNRITGERRAEG